MRALALAAVATMLAGCMTTTAGPTEVDVNLATPASIELTQWCASGGTSCDQAAADRAQSHCRGSGKNAQLAGAVLIERGMIKGEKTAYRFNCVN